MGEDARKEMLALSAQLRHYKRRDIQEEIALQAQDREVAFRYGSRGFGSRPDIIAYPTDILEAVKRGASSFHCSEERWSDPLALVPGMRPQEFEELRIGWDLVLDIDCPHWEHAKIVTDLLVKALQKKGISSISCKFSGNKGFHIGVPFETFPETVHNKPTETQFPEGVHRIARYLAYLIDSKEMGHPLSRAMLKLGEETLAEQLGVSQDALHAMVCEKCGEPKETRQAAADEYICRNNLCQAYNTSAPANERHRLKVVCPECGKLREKTVITAEESERCRHCGGTSFEERFNSSLVLNLDTQLISARHLYRMPFSMHEKSGLVSVPIDPDKVLAFEKEEAAAERVEIVEKFRFLDRNTAKQGEASRLLIDAWDHWDRIGGIAGKLLKESGEATENKEVEIPVEAVPESAFPPCVQLGFKGLRDGRKRFLFALVNFLHSLGWGYDQIEARLKEWNALNPEPLGDTLIVGQVRYHKQQKKRVLPPNCANKHYYTDIAICKPDELCRRIKNPVSYAKRKARYEANSQKRSRSSGTRQSRAKQDTSQD